MEPKFPREFLGTWPPPPPLPARTRLLREAAERFKLSMDDFEGVEWLIAADWIEHQGDEELAAEVRNTSAKELGTIRNPCACGRTGVRGYSEPPPLDGKIFGWSCDYCGRKTGVTESWVERVILWNLMNPLKEPDKQLWPRSDGNKSPGTSSTGAG